LVWAALPTQPVGSATHLAVSGMALCLCEANGLGSTPFLSLVCGMSCARQAGYEPYLNRLRAAPSLGEGKGGRVSGVALCLQCVVFSVWCLVFGVCCVVFFCLVWEVLLTQSVGSTTFTAVSGVALCLRYLVFGLLKASGPCEATSLRAISKEVTSHTFPRCEKQRAGLRCGVVPVVSGVWRLVCGVEREANNLNGEARNLTFGSDVWVVPPTRMCGSYYLHAEAEGLLINHHWTDHE
jgi:hypothetical protein